MAVERDDAARELRLEGAPLFAVGAVIVAAICGAFFAGRWVERRDHASRSITVADEPGPLSQVVETGKPADAGADADFFDRVDGSRPPEPQREARSRPVAPASADTEARPDPSTASTPPKSLESPDSPDSPDSNEVPASTEAAGREPTPPQASANGEFFVQVFAGHDRTAARQVIDRLKGEGYEVRLFDESGVGGAIVRVRVGGYPSEDRARTIAGNLRKSGYADAFVTRVD